MMKSFFFFIVAFCLSAQSAWSETTTNKVENLAEPKVVSGDVSTAEQLENIKVDPQKEAKEVVKVAQRAKVEKEKKKKKSVNPWDTFEPPADSKYDWVQLTSGEWLKGDLVVFYNYVVEFDSDELDLLELDFEDIKRIRTHDMKTIFWEGDGGRRDTSVMRGMLVVNGDTVLVRRADKDIKISRDKIISIASGKNRERDFWSGMFSLGVTARGGNTKTTDATIIANIKRRTAESRFNADYFASYSRTEGSETVNNQRLNGYYDRFLTARFYWQVSAAEFYRDPFSNIDAQYSLSSGFGYDLIHNPKTEWRVLAGVGYQNQEFVSVLPGESGSANSPFFTAGMRFDHEVTKSIDYLFDYSLRVLNKNNGLYTHHLLTTLSFDLFKDLDLDISFVWDRVENPQQSASGTTPEQDDYQVIVGVSYEF